MHKMSTDIDGKVCENYPSRTIGINFKDGDEFGFFIGPTDVHDDGNIPDKDFYIS